MKTFIESYYLTISIFFFNFLEYIREAHLPLLCHFHLSYTHTYNCIIYREWHLGSQNLQRLILYWPPLVRFVLYRIYCQDFS